MDRTGAGRITLLKRVWRTAQDVDIAPASNDTAACAGSAYDPSVLRIKRSSISADIENFRFNRAVASEGMLANAIGEVKPHDKQVLLPPNGLVIET